MGKKFVRPWALAAIVAACGGGLGDLGDASNAADAAPDATTTDVVDESDSTSPCGKDQVLCGNTCYMNDVSHCGPSCTQCAAPTNGFATCDGKTCGFTCNTLQCGSACVDPLTDTHNCGKCGHDCGSTQCAAGMCIPQNLYFMNGIGGIAVDGTNLYWWAGIPGSIYQGPKVGGVTPTTLASNVGSLLRPKIEDRGRRDLPGFSGPPIPAKSTLSFLISNS